MNFNKRIEIVENDILIYDDIYELEDDDDVMPIKRILSLIELLSI